MLSLLLFLNTASNLIIIGVFTGTLSLGVVRVKKVTVGDVIETKGAEG
jgi:hypothetical protein